MSSFRTMWVGLLVLLLAGGAGATRAVPSACREPIGLLREAAAVPRPGVAGGALRLCRGPGCVWCASGAPAGWLMVGGRAGQTVAFDAGGFDRFQLAADLAPETTTQLAVSLIERPVQLTWSVTPTSIPTQFDVTLSVQFKTDPLFATLVPEPVGMSVAVPFGGRVTGGYTLTNKGGVKAENIAIFADVTQGPVAVTPLVSSIPELLPGQSVAIPLAATFGSGAPGKGVVRMLHRGTFVSLATRATIPTESGVLVYTEGLAAPVSDAGLPLPGRREGVAEGERPPGAGFGGGVGGGLVVTVQGLPPEQALPPPSVADPASGGLTVPEAFKCSSVELGPIPSPLFLGEPFRVRVVGEPTGGTVRWVSTIGAFDNPAGAAATLTPNTTGPGFVDAEYRVVVQGRDTVSRDGRVVTVEPAKVRVRFPQGRAVQVGSGRSVEVEYLADLPDGVQVTLSSAPVGTSVTPPTLPGGAAGLVQTVQVTAGQTPSGAVNDVEVTVSSATAPATVLGRGQVTVWRFTPGVCTGKPDAEGRFVVPYRLEPGGFAKDAANLVVRTSTGGFVFEAPASVVADVTDRLAVWNEFDWVEQDPWAGPYVLVASLTAVGVSTQTPGCPVELPRLTFREEAFATGLDTTTVVSTCVPIAQTPLRGTTELPNLFMPYSPSQAHTLSLLVEPTGAVGLVSLRSQAFVGSAAGWSVSPTVPASSTSGVVVAGVTSGKGVVQGVVKSAPLWTRFNTSTVPTRGLVVESAPIIRVPVVVHLVKAASGDPTKSTTRTPNDVGLIFSEVNKIWERQAGVRFAVQLITVTVVSDNLAVPASNADVSNLTRIGNTPGAIDVFFIQNFGGGLAGTNGMIDQPLSPSAVAGIDGGEGATIRDQVPASTVAHELGHALGLPNLLHPGDVNRLTPDDVGPEGRCPDDLLRLMRGVGGMTVTKGVIVENATDTEEVKVVAISSTQNVLRTTGNHVPARERSTSRTFAQAWDALPGP